MLSRDELNRAYVTLASLLGEDPHVNFELDEDLVDTFNDAVKEWYDNNVDVLPSANQIKATFMAANSRLEDDSIYVINSLGEERTGAQLKAGIDNFYRDGEWDFSKARGDVYMVYNWVYTALTSAL